MKTAYLGLGSNLGERRVNLAAAVRILAADPAIVVMRGSSVYESKPVGVLNQPDFLNMVVQIETTHNPPELLSACLSAEAALGRERRERWGPRIIDIDVLGYDGLVWQDERLELPHPRMHERSFVLTPLAEIAPDLPLQGTSVQAWSARVGNEGLVHNMAWTEFLTAAGLSQREP